MIVRFLIGAIICLIVYWSGFLTAALLSVRKEDTELFDRTFYLRCDDFSYLSAGSNCYYDTFGTCIIKVELIIEGGDNDGRIESSNSTESGRSLSNQG